MPLLNVLQMSKNLNNKFEKSLKKIIIKEVAADLEAE